MQYSIGIDFYACFCSEIPARKSKEMCRPCQEQRRTFMSDGQLKRQLKVLTIPVFIEIALVMMMGAVDTVMLSRYSDNSVAAVGLDNQLISLVFLVYQFFSMGRGVC